MSTSSFLDEVEMAQDEMFSGPMGESVPTSVSSFAHRRGRADSTASFTYYQDDEEQENLPPSDENDSAILDDESELDFEEDRSVDLEAGELAEMRRTSSGHSRASVHDRLLRSDSTRTDGSNLGRGHRTSQKIYIVTEDLTIVVAGFRTSTLGFAVYTTICVLTLGLGYLLLRWLPRWQVRIVGRPCSLRDCSWVVIEVSNSWRNVVFQETLKIFLHPHCRDIYCRDFADVSRINGESSSFKT
jgi:cation-transporting ATPase 13A3/4/5